MSNLGLEVGSGVLKSEKYQMCKPGREVGGGVLKSEKALMKGEKTTCHL